MKPSKTMAVALLLLSGFMPKTVQSAAAQTPSPTPTTQPVNTQPAAFQMNTPAAPRVIGIEGNLEADDLIRVEVANLAEWAKTNNPSKLIPYLNGLGLTANYPEEIHASENHLHYHLRITAQNKKVWIDLLGAPEHARKPVAFSVGLDGQSPFESVFHEPDNTVQLTVISPVYGVIAFIIVVATLVLLIWLAKKTSIIRERGPKVGGKLRPYNLGRTQMAFWFFLIYASYIVIWLITDALDTITPALLGLMGISAATALSEAMIDSSKNDARDTQLRDLTAEKESLEQSIPELQSQVTALSSKTSMTADDLSNRDSLNAQLQVARTRLGQANKQIKDLTPQSSSAVSAGFLRDILADATGYSFHRFQIFAWTIVLGGMFISSVYNQLTMPEFSATLLGLMGISSGTYIGFKFPEEK